MITKIDPDFSRELIKYGADNFQKCYNCGNCTAICNLTEESVNFPRMFIRDGLLGLKKNILKSRELWMCYGCGDCSESCPRQADPGAYMSALRRFAIGQYDVTGISRNLFKSKLFTVLFISLLSVMLGFFMLTLKPEHNLSRWLFTYIPYEVIHTAGIVIFIITGISMAAGIINMALHVSNSGKNKANAGSHSVLKAARGLYYELHNMSRHRQCDSEEDSTWSKKPYYLKPWFIHYCIMWGFMGLLLATVLDFIFKNPDISIWWPTRLLGTLSGLMMMYGSTLSVFYRLKKVTKFFKDTTFSDWLFIDLIWVAGFTGFWLEVSVTFNLNDLVSQGIFLVHIIVSMELVLLFAFSKFAHVAYRPVALFFYYLEKN